MLSGHCFTAEHHQKRVSCSSWKFLAKCKLRYFYFAKLRNKADEEHNSFLWPWSHLPYVFPMAFIPTRFLPQAFAKYGSLAGFFPYSFHISFFKPLKSNWFWWPGHNSGLFSPLHGKDVITVAHQHFLSTKDTPHHLPACSICLQAFRLL